MLANRTTIPFALYEKSWSSVPMLLWLWVGLFLVRGLLYLFLVPPWQAPDEPTSMELLLTIQARGRLVSIPDKDPAIEHQIIESMRRTRYWDLGGFAFTTSAVEGQSFADIYGLGATQLHRPPLYQISLLPIAWLTQDWLLEHQLMVLRAASLAFGVLTVVVAVCIGHHFSAVHPAIPFIFPALIVLHPQFAYSSASFNADNLATTLSACAFLVMLWMTQKGLSWRYVSALAILLVLGLWTKRTTLFVTPAVLFATMRAGWLQKQRLSGIQLRWKVITTIFILCAGVIWMVLPQRIYSLGMGIEQYVLNTNVREYYRHITFGFARLTAPILPTMWSIISFFNISFWASFGWHAVNAPQWLTSSLLACTLVTWCSTCSYLLIARTTLPLWARDYMVLCVFAVITTLFLIFLNRFPFGLIPGRYLFPAILPVLLFVAIGTCWWWPPHWSVPGATGILFALVVLDLYTMGSVVIPGFYQR